MEAAGSHRKYCSCYHYAVLLRNRRMGIEIFRDISDHAGKNATEADYFTGFIGGNIAPVVFMIIFMAATFFIVYNGVDKGIEKCSRILMPILFVIILIVVAFSLTLSFTDENGVTRTGLPGLKSICDSGFCQSDTEIICFHGH